jgi:3-hydroxyisobutyrate dehydrogenase
VSAPRVGVIGLGRMGLPICARLCAAGYAVIATDLRRECSAAALAAGARWAPTSAALAADVDIAITILPGAAEVSALIAELTGALAPGATWIDMSTAAPAVARAIAAAAEARGLRALDAPVGGNPPAAREGRLLCFAGAHDADLEAVRPLLAALAQEIVHAGPPGCGYAVKLLVNLLWFAQAVATAEALALARRAGIDLDQLLAALGRSAAASAFIADDAPSLLRGDDLASFPLARCCEQLASVLALGEELAVPLELAGIVARLHEGALERYGDVDGELLGARWVAQRAGVRLDS